jgi:hypothetical protein
MVSIPPTPPEPPSPPVIPVSESDGMKRYKAWQIERANVLAAMKRPDIYQRFIAFEGERELIEQLIHLDLSIAGEVMEFERIDRERGEFWAE